jgi:hypothetical protein
VSVEDFLAGLIHLFIALDQAGHAGGGTEERQGSGAASSGGRRGELGGSPKKKKGSIRGMLRGVSSVFKRSPSINKDGGGGKLGAASAESLTQDERSRSLQVCGKRKGQRDEEMGRRVPTSL